MVNLDVPEVRIQAIQEVVNLLMYHGSAPYNNITDPADDLTDENNFEVSFYTTFARAFS
jgi:hypothetical protein